MLDKASVPRRSLDFEDYLAILRRNFRWLLGPMFAGLVISTVVAYLLPDTYVSQALIRIVPQQISPEVVQNITAEDVADRINGMAQTIESHNTLSTIITSFGLYKGTLKHAPLEDVIAAMQKDIHIKPVEGVTNVTGKALPAMQVSFAYKDPYTAQKVCQDIVSRFMNASTQNSLDIEQQAYQFLSDQAEQARHDVSIADQKLADFRTKNAGRLPEEVSTNLAQMSALQQRGAQVSDGQARLAEQKMMLESELREAKDRLSGAGANSPMMVAQNQKLEQMDREIEQTQNSIDSMQRRYTDKFPDLQTARDRLQALKNQREAAAKEKPDTSGSAVESAAVSRERAEAQSVVNQLQLQLKANTMESQRILKQESQVNQALGGYQSRLESAPAGQKEYQELLGDSMLTRQRYMELDQKRQKSATSLELERRKQGETLEVLDSASLPTTPSAPKRQMIVPAGAVVGLVLGVLIIGMREVRDTSLKSLKDARAYTQLSILGSVPLLENDVVVQRRKQVMWVGWAAATALGLAVIAGSIVHYYLSKRA